MNLIFSLMMPPEESYSRRLDKEVASQEHPYGCRYRNEFRETGDLISKVEREDKKQDSGKLK